MDETITRTQNTNSGQPNLDLTNRAITSNDLKPQEDFKLPPAKPATAASALSGAIDQEVDAFTENLQEQKTEAQKQTERTKQNYIESILGGEGELTATARQYSREGGVDDLQKELNNINQELRVEQNALRRQLERLQKNPEGLFGGALTDEMNRVERESLAKQADLSVIQMGIQGRYDSAKAIADRAVAVKLEQQSRVNEALRIQYEDNKELFTKSEQRLFESQLSDRNRKLEQEREDEQAKYDLAIEAQKNGAPRSVVQNMLSSKTREEALSQGGGFIGKLDREIKAAQLSKLYQDLSGEKEQKSLTSAQYQALGFGERMLSAANIIDQGGEQFTSIGSNIAGNRFFPNFLKTDDRQIFEQAQRNFINAILRRESGAAISPEEFSSASEQYFPQPGDGQAVLIQKKLNRDMVTKNMLAEAGQDTQLLDASIQDPLSLGIKTSDPLGLTQ